MTISNLQEAEAALRPYVPLVKQLTGKHTVLTRIKPLMKSLGNPQDRLKIIHIAGTSGKTSTSYYMAALLKAAGLKVGLTVSPHIDSITERIQIGGRPMDEAEFCRELGIFLDIVQQTEHKPSYFELLYAFVMWVLSRRDIDYAVVETGLGGLQDATNVAARPDKVCIITDIGFDHQQVLGRTLPEIAAQKIGIVHDHNHVFMYRQPDEVQSVMDEWISAHHAALHLVKGEEKPAGNLLPAYQWRNWLLAYNAYKYLRDRDNLQNLTSQALSKSQLAQVPARMETRRINGKTLIMDGAHNGQKMAAFADSFRRLYPEAKPAVLLSFKTGKEYKEAVELLAPLASRVIVTTFAAMQDVPIKSMPPDELAEAFVRAGAQNVKIIADSADALKALLAGKEEACVITGSFYLLGQIRNNEIL